jgi:hypothetical protein
MDISYDTGISVIFLPVLLITVYADVYDFRMSLLTMKTSDTDKVTVSVNEENFHGLSIR